VAQSTPTRHRPTQALAAREARKGARRIAETRHICGRTLSKRAFPTGYWGTCAQWPRRVSTQRFTLVPPPSPYQT
jgi:hypothetical protein